ncbi:MAG: HIT family protein [Syntrophobacteraceae bacterium]|nr:HIT family protein [Syntrophobacteraceae bacterium]
MADCIFCKIAKGEIPCAKICEDERALGFVDIGPINPGHALVIPKKHYATLFEMDVEDLQACIVMAQKVARAVLKAMAPAGLNLLQNNFRAAGQLVEHAHFHLIPRQPQDRFLAAWPTKSYAAGEIEKILQKVKGAL